MVFTEPPQALFFRIELNKNYIYAFLAQKTKYTCFDLDVQKVAELVEDRLNVVDIMKTPTLNIHNVIRSVIHEQVAGKHSSDD